MLEYLGRLLPQMAQGTGVTLGIFGATIVLSLPLGFLFCLARLSRFRALRFITDIYIWVMRGSPLILQLIAIYYGLPYLGITLGDFDSAVVAFSLNYAAYFAEIFRGGIQSIPQGQYEAAQVLSLTRRQTMARIILPQALKRSLPSIGNEVNILVKDSALLYAIGMTDILRVAQIASIRDLKFEPYILALVFYLVFSFLLERAFVFIEKRFGYKE